MINNLNSASYANLSYTQVYNICKQVLQNPFAYPICIINCATSYIDMRESLRSNLKFIIYNRTQFKEFLNLKKLHKHMINRGSMIISNFFNDNEKISFFHKYKNRTNQSILRNKKQQIISLLFFLQSNNLDDIMKFLTMRNNDDFIGISKNFIDLEVNLTMTSKYGYLTELILFRLMKIKGK